MNWDSELSAASSDLEVLPQSDQYIKRTNAHLQSWLRFNQSLTVSSDDVLQECVGGVVEIFGGYADLFLFLGKFAGQQHIQSMHKLLKHTQISSEQRASNTIDIKIEQVDEDSDSDSAYSEDIDLSPMRNPFESVPHETLSHICEFLSYANIEKLKLVSRQMGIVCLTEHTKFQVQELEASKLMAQGQHLFRFSSELFSASRHNPNKQMYSFMQEWQLKFNIPERNQLIVSLPSESNYGPNRRSALRINLRQGVELVDFQSWRLHAVSTIKSRNFLVCDTRKVVMLDTKQARRMDVERDTWAAYGGNYKFVALEFFDVFRQECKVVQFLLCAELVSCRTILEYVEHKFIHTERMDQGWHTRMLATVQQMDAQMDKLAILEHRDGGWHGGFNKVDTFNLDLGLRTFRFTVQLNPSHPWFATAGQVQVDAARFNFEQKLEGFHLLASTFCETSVNARVHFEGDKALLSQAVAKCYASKRNGSNLEMSTTLNTIERFNGEASKIRTSTTTQSGGLRIKVASLLGGIVKPNHVELFTKSRYGQQRSCRKQWKETYFDLNRDKIFFDVVLYNVRAPVPAHSRIFKVKVYTLGQGAYPFHTAEQSRTITVKHKKEFRVGAFVQTMFQSIHKAKGHVLQHMHQDLLDLYFEGADKNSNKKRQKKPVPDSSVTCVLVRNKPRHMHYWGYHGQDGVGAFLRNDEFEAAEQSKDCVQHLDLYLIQTAPRNLHEGKVKLNLKFAQNTRGRAKFNAKTPVAALRSMEWIGMPLVLWIDPEDTLQHIIDNCLKEQTRECIQCAYRVSSRQSAVNIPKAKRGKYKPHQELLKHGPRGFIVFVLPKTRTRDKKLPVFPAKVHAAVHGPI